MLFYWDSAVTVIKKIYGFRLLGKSILKKAEKSIGLNTNFPTKK